MKIKHLALGVLIIILNIVNCIAAENDFIYKIDRLSVSDGLPHVDVLGVIEDEKGFMWFATLSGICRYDGFNIVTINADNKYNINKNRCWTIHSNKEGDFWLGTQGGIMLFSPKTETYIEIKHPFTKFDTRLNSDTRINCIDNNNNLWATINGVLYVLATNNDSITSITNILDQLKLTSEMYTTEVIEDKNNNIWVGTNKGLLQLQKTKQNAAEFKILKTHSTNTHISSLTINSKGNIVAGSYRGFIELELIYGDEKTIVKNIKTETISYEQINQTSNKNDKISISLVTSIVEDANGNYWIGTDGGLIMFQKKLNNSNKRFTIYNSSLNDPFSLSSDLTNDLYINKNQCLFAGTFAGGVNIIDLKQKQINWIYKNNEDKKSSLEDNFIRAIEEDENGNIWIGTQNHGISYYDIKNKINYPINIDNKGLGYDRNKVRTIKLEKNKLLWIGTQNEIYCLDINTRQLINLPEEFNDKIKIEKGFFTDIKIDKFNNIWFSTWENGVFQCIREENNSISFKAINHFHTHRLDENKLINNTANTITISENKNQIFITTANGIEKLILDNHGEVKIIHHHISSLKEGEPSSNFVWDLIEIEPNTFWMGTIGGGVYKVFISDSIDQQGFGNIKSLPINIPNNIELKDIECIVTDKNKNLWIGSKTLHFYDTKKDILQPYDFEESVFQNNFKVGAAHAGKSGLIYLGGIKGINYFDPTNIKPDNSIPFTQIAEIWVHNKPLVVGEKYNGKVLLKKSTSYTNAIKLNYLQNNFTIVFTANLFENPQKVTYKYMLDGIDENWNYTTGSNPKVTYANLPYKTYTFKVLAANNDGFWSESPRELQIRIMPPWWKSNIANLIYGLFIIWLLVGGYLYLKNYYKFKHDLEIAKVEETKKEEVHQMKLQFFTNISHEFRTPLSLIIAPLEELMSADQSFSNRKKLYSVIENNAKKLLGLVNELIEFRRLENKILKLKTVKQDINIIVKEAAEPFRRVAESKNINFQINAATKALNGWFDKSILDRIITNLLSNAFKHTKEKGSITIEIIEKFPESILTKKTPRYSLLSEKKADKYIGILIKDNGDGISEKSLPLIFDRYFQVEKDPTRHLGSGIGLAIVKNLILLHYGEIIVESKREEGTSFLIKLPMSDEIYDKTEKTTNLTEAIRSNSESISELLLNDSNATYNYSSDEFKTKTVFIIEDEEGIREFLATKLSEKYIIYNYENANLALNEIDLKNPDIIISDIMMPGMDGFEFCKLIKENMSTCHIPVILLTAKSDLVDLINGAECGADQFITKPFSMKHLHASINNLLHNRRILIEKYKNDNLFELGTICKSESDKKIIDQILRLIKENLDDPMFSVEFLSKELGIGRTKLYKTIKTITGLTLGEVIRDVKMKVAAQLLISSDVTISEVAEQVGVSPNFFYVMFKEYYGMTPSEFQKNNMK